MFGHHTSRADGSTFLEFKLHIENSAVYVEAGSAH